MPERTYRPLLYALALCGLALDQGSKYGVFAWLAERPRNTFPIFQDAQQKGFVLVAQFERNDDGSWKRDDNNRKVPHVNHGALFGFLRDYESHANAGFAAVSLLAAVAIVLWATQRATARDRMLCISLGLILGGTLGNLYDRVVFNGVRDFLHWNYLFDWPVFNLADCCLVIGAGLMLLQAFFGPQAATQPKAETRALSAEPAVASGAVKPAPTREVRPA
jgi:lipoprotein signal peptidase